MPKDIMCYLGGRFLTIVRIHKDYCELIAFVAAWTVTKDPHSSKGPPTWWSRGGYVEFFLAWDLQDKHPQEECQDDLRRFLERRGFERNHPGRLPVDRTRRLLAVGELLVGLERFSEAISRFKRIIGSRTRAAKPDFITTSQAMSNLVWLSWLRGRGDDNRRAKHFKVMLKVQRRAPGYATFLSPKALAVFILVPQIQPSKFSKDLPEAAVSQADMNHNILRLLVYSDEDPLSITESVLVSAAKNDEFGVDMMSLFLTRRQDLPTITNSILRTACTDVKVLLLTWDDPAFSITYDLVTVIFSSFEISSSVKWNSNRKEVLSGYIRGNTEPIIIDARTVHTIADLAAQCNEQPLGQLRSGTCYDILVLLLECNGDKITFTEEASRALAECFPD